MPVINVCAGGGLPWRAPACVRRGDDRIFEPVSVSPIACNSCIYFCIYFLGISIAVLQNIISGTLHRYIIVQWTDSLRRIKLLLIILAGVITLASLVYTHRIARNLRAEEQSRMEVWAEAMRTLSMADDDTNLSLVLKVINENNYIPVIVLDSKGQATTFRNVRLHGQNYQDSLQEATLKGRQLLDDGRCIRIQLGNSTGSDYINVCYDDSRILKQLNYFPYVYLAIVVIFFGVVIFALLMSKRAEQNRVWAGLSKETAHQLGTPISSLMAWVEILKEEYPNDELIPEMDKDVQRLQLIADRFSKVGSKPEMKEESLTTVIDHVVDYMDRRTSRRVRMIKDVPDHDIMVCLNVNLFEWVVENLCKNAADAMGGGAGTITLRLEETGKLAVLEVSDTGKGIRKKDLANVFRPGFTTKKRGWGLGLSLAKRIVEDYHKGRIFVKWSEVGVGTTFRIELSK